MVIQYSSPAGQRFGFMARDLVGRISIDTVHPDDRLNWQTAWDAALADPTHPQSVEVRRRPDGGDWRLLSSEITNMVDFPTVGGVVISSRDVTESRRQAVAFAATEQTLRSILQNSVEGVWVVGPSGSTVFVNAYMADLLGATLATMADYSVHDLLPDAVSLRANGDDAAFRRQHEFTFRRPGGQVRWIRANIVSRFDAAGAYCGAILMCADITEQRTSVEYSVRAALAPVPPIDSAPSSTAALSSIMAKLSARETAVVARLLDGDRVPTIAQTLFVSQSTVRNQLSSVFRKTQVASQQELIRLLRPARN
jgi:PAS domain S-box-containing protein